MTLSPEQTKLLTSGRPVPMVVGNTPCILLRQDVFDQLRTQYDDSAWTDVERAMLAEEMFASLDRAEPIS